MMYLSDSGDAVSWWVIKDLLRQLPDVHHSLLRYLCNFLTLMERNHKENRMTAHNLATVFGPSVFKVVPSFEAVKDQNICNKIMVQLIQNYSCIFEARIPDKADHTDELSTLRMVKTELKEEDRPSCDSPAPHIKNDLNSLEDMQHLNKSCNKTPKSKKTKVRKVKNNGMPQVACQPRLVSPSTRSFSIPIVLPLTSELRSPSPEVMNTSPLPEVDTLRTASPHVDFSLSGSTEGLSRLVPSEHLSLTEIIGTGSISGKIGCDRPVSRGKLKPELSGVQFPQSWNSSAVAAPVVGLLNAASAQVIEVALGLTVHLHCYHSVNICILM
ncbi:hypothetical protein XENORESO_002282 [Xenotaenia resolanae]|uniref:Rho-GAP domain-containing protein n=1 Tax=Xenotaenia resolanae TaxID=208358 RepID=A0ABV0W275_9TELE